MRLNILRHFAIANMEGGKNMTTYLIAVGILGLLVGIVGFFLPSDSRKNKHDKHCGAH